MTRIVKWVLAAVVAVLVCPAGALASQDITGTWAPGSTDPLNKDDNATYAVAGDGSISGHARVASNFFTVSGSESPSGAVTIYYTLGAYVATDTGQVTRDGNCMSGTFSDTQGGSGIWSWVRNGATAKDDQCDFGRKSATAVNCSGLDGTYDCTATIADASGNQPQQTPTGSVTFSAQQGGFPNGATCALTPSQAGPTAFCHLTYHVDGGVPTGTPVPVTAAYSGDATFAPSSGKPGPSVAVTPSPTPSPSPTATPTPAPTPTPTPTPSPAPNPTPCPATGTTHAATKTTLTTTSRAKTPAAKRAIALLRSETLKAAHGLALYEKTVPKGTKVGTRKLKAKADLFWQDEATLARYQHPGVLLALDATTHRPLTQIKTMDRPTVSFPAKPILERRPIHRLAKASIKTLTTGKSFANALAKAGRRLTAHTAENNSHDQLITLVNTGDHRPGDTFINEQNAIVSQFAKHNVATTTTTSISGLYSATTDAVNSGKTTITFFLDGHGYAPPNWVDPADGKTYQGDPVPGISLGAGQVIRPDDLTNLMQAYPDVKFNFVIDACYSGRFTDSLSREPNHGVVTTSASANEMSWGPATLQSNPDGTISLLPDKTGTDVSSFTEGEINALNATWDSATLDVSQALDNALEEEAKYDWAAENGMTHPNQPPKCET